MANNFRATAAKRQRELDQKDRVRDRAERRAERRERIKARVASGESGPPIGDPLPPLSAENDADASSDAE